MHKILRACLCISAFLATAAFAAPILKDAKVEVFDQDGKVLSSNIVPINASETVNVYKLGNLKPIESIAIRLQARNAVAPNDNQTLIRAAVDHMYYAVIEFTAGQGDRKEIVQLPEQKQVFTDAQTILEQNGIWKIDLANGRSIQVSLID